MDGRRRAWVNAARLVMIGLAVVVGWAAVTAAGGTGNARDFELAGPPSLTATAAPAPPNGIDTADDSEAGQADEARRAARGSRSRDRLDPRLPDCDGVRAAGLGPYRQDRDAEYRWYPDADRDGVTCD